MATQYLRKDVNRSYEDISSADADQPGTAPSQDTGGYWRTETYEVSVGTTETVVSPGWVNDGGSTGGLDASAPVGETQDGRQFEIADGYSGQSYERTVRQQTETRTRRVWVPAGEGDDGTPPAPAPPEPDWQWIIDRRLGWNSGARSIKRLDGDLYFSFRVQPANNTGVGLARGRQGTHYRMIPFAFLFNNGRYRITELGKEVYGPVAYDPADTFQILRIAGEVVYKHNEQVVHRSTKTSTGSLIVVSAMYTGGDRVI